MIRWNIIKKAYQVAADSFKTQDLLIDFPKVLEKTGSLSVYLLPDLSGPIGKLDYNIVHADDFTGISISCNNVNKIISTSSFEPISCKVAMSKDLEVGSVEIKDGSASSIALVLAQKYGEEVDYSEFKDLEDSEEIQAELVRNGINVYSQLKIKEAQDIPLFRKYKQYDKVRVNNEKSMEYQECATVLDCVGNIDKGFKYFVLVDGSSKPIWISEDELVPIEAGKVE